MLARAGDQTLSLYLDGQGIDEHLGVASEKDVFAYETDHLGSVLNTDPAGSLRGYGAFGETIGFGPWITKHSDPVMYGFAGRAYDAESDLYYNRARMYDPTTGRFTTLDPIGFAGGDANLYRYVGNNPLRWTDPSGLAPGDQFLTPDAAGYDVLNFINPTSIVLGREYAGTVYQNANGTFSATVPNAGTLAGSSHGPINADTVGLYHTHGANDPGYLNESYSTLDINNVLQLGIPSYLGTPSGNFLSLDPTGRLGTLRGGVGGACSR